MIFQGGGGGGGPDPCPPSGSAHGMGKTKVHIHILCYSVLEKYVTWTCQVGTCKVIVLKKKFLFQKKVLLLYKVSTVNFCHVKKLVYSKTCVKRPLKNKQNKDLNDKW